MQEILEIENNDADDEDTVSGAFQDTDLKVKGKCVVVKTTTR